MPTMDSSDDLSPAALAVVVVVVVLGVVLLLFTVCMLCAIWFTRPGPPRNATATAPTEFKAVQHPDGAACVAVTVA